MLEGCDDLAKEKNKQGIASTVDSLIREEVEKLGYILWDVEYKKEGSEYNLILTIDSDEREITIDDCVAVTYAVNPILDEADPITDSYCLEVSSAGLERELTQDFHFEKYLGRSVEVRLFAPHEKLAKNFVLPIKAYSSDSVTFAGDGGEITIEKNKISSVKTVVDYEKIFSDKEND